jgi:hypothetical protein
MGIFVDTNLRVTNFQPSATADRSERVMEGKLLLPPFIWLPTSLPSQHCKYNNDRDNFRIQLSYYFSKTVDSPPAPETVHLLSCIKSDDPNSSNITTVSSLTIIDNCEILPELQLPDDVSIIIKYNPYNLPLLSRPLFAVRALNLPSELRSPGTELKDMIAFAAQKLTLHSTIPLHHV